MFIKHRFSEKRYQELIKEWNPHAVVHIHYRTKNSDGYMRLSVKFFLEFYNRITKLFKGCIIIDIIVKDEVLGTSTKLLFSLYDAWIYLVGVKYGK